MMKDFVNEISRILKIERRNLVEKDLILQRLLIDLSKDDFYHNNFLFKGGTCLIKCYLGYYRFSEDIDFTWKNQNLFQNKSQKEVRRYLSEVINRIGELFEKISANRALDFKCDKQNKDYVELGGGNKTVTFKIWHSSEIMNRRSFVKVQINFVEDLKFKAVEKKLINLLDGKQTKELDILFPEELAEYSQSVTFDAYDIREILCEKVRSILTRRGVKARDFVDVYLISKRFGYKPESLEKEILGKVNFVLKLYARYRNNIDEKKRLLDSGKIFTWGDEKRLLISDVSEKEFYEFLADFRNFLQDIIKKQERSSGTKEM